MKWKCIDEYFFVKQSIHVQKYYWSRRLYLILFIWIHLTLPKSTWHSFHCTQVCSAAQASSPQRWEEVKVMWRPSVETPPLNGRYALVRGGTSHIVLVYMIVYYICWSLVCLLCWCSISLLVEMCETNDHLRAWATIIHYVWELDHIHVLEKVSIAVFLTHIDWPAISIWCVWH